MTAHMEQVARDSCLSVPKHPPKFSVAMHRGFRLFGEAAILPLQSQVRFFPSNSTRTSIETIHEENVDTSPCTNWVASVRTYMRGP